MDIDRNTLEASILTRTDRAGLSEPDLENIVYDLVEIVDTVYDKHIPVIMKRKAVGDVMERPVWRISELAASTVRGQKMLRKMGG